MNVKIDFQLNQKFGVVEQIIYRLVLNGFTDAREIAEALPVFSDTVIANAIKHLVNSQILCAKVDERVISLSEPVIAIIEMCLDNSFEIEAPPKLENALRGEGILITGTGQEEVMKLKKAILYELLPAVNLDVYIGSLDFVISGDQRGDQDE